MTRAEIREEMGEMPTRQLEGCVTGMCGADDCPTCRGAQSAREYQQEMEEAE